jgi:HEAT repeat protein
VRARLGSPRVQAAALRAIGALGGEGVMDALLAGVARGGETAAAAADGLARLGDPSAAPVLIALLGEGGASPAFEPARRGLAAFGAAVRTELVRTARTASHPARVEAALLLSEQLAPEAAPILIDVLRNNAGNVRAASELAVLACVDFRGEADAAGAWQRWLDYAVKDDAQAWMCGGMERLGVAAPPPGDLRAGTPEAFAFLARALARPEAFVVERARRELARLTGREIGAVPPVGPEREAWLAELEAALEARDAAAR